MVAVNKFNHSPMDKTTSPTVGVRFTAEFIGTYILVATLIIAYFMTLLSGGNALLYALSYGATLAVLIAVFQGWSYQFNPIVSLVAFITRQQTLPHLGAAFLGQVLGAVLASRTVVGLTNMVPTINAQVPAVDAAGLSLTMISALEGFGILLLLLTYIWGSRSENATHLPLIAGLSVIPGSALAVFVSGGALNPVRVLGPAFFMGSAWKSMWVFWVGPIIAALVAVIVMGILMKNRQHS